MCVCVCIHSESGSIDPARMKYQVHQDRLKTSSIHFENIYTNLLHKNSNSNLNDLISIIFYGERFFQNDIDRIRKLTLVVFSTVDPIDQPDILIECDD